MQSILLVATEKQSSFSISISIYTTLNQSRSIFQFFLAIEFISKFIGFLFDSHRAQGIVNCFHLYSILFFIFISIARCSTFLIKLQIDVNVNAINCHLISSCNSLNATQPIAGTLERNMSAHLIFFDPLFLDHKIFSFSLIWFFRACACLPEDMSF